MGAPTECAQGIGYFGCVCRAIDVASVAAGRPAVCVRHVFVWWDSHCRLRLLRLTYLSVQLLNSHVACRFIASVRRMHASMFTELGGCVGCTVS